MTKNFTLILLLFCSLAHAQNFKWAFKAGGTSYDAGKGIEVDANGNFYVIGGFSGTTSFDSSGFARTLTSTGGTDFFLVKYNCARVMQWRVKIGSTLDDVGIYMYAGISLDPSGNIFLSSSFNGTCSFNSTTGSPIVLTAGSGTLSDAFLAKYNNQGVAQWVQKIGSSARDEGCNVHADAYGNVFTTGSFSGTCTFGSSSGTPPQLSSAGSTDIYIAKYNTSGALKWVKKAGGSNDDVGVDIKPDKAGNLIVTGSVSCCGSSVVTFGSLATFTGKGSWDGFVAKCDSNGTWLWVNPIASTGADGCPAVVLDSSGNVYIAGAFSGTVTFSTTSGSSSTLSSTGGLDLYYCKYNNSGVRQWSFKAGSTQDEDAQGLCISDSGSIYLLAYFYGTITFGSGSTAVSLSSSGGRDICVVKYNSSGTVEWVQKAGGTGNETAGDIVIDKAGDFLITGGFQNSISIGRFNMSSSGNLDVFVAKSAVLSIITNNAAYCPGDSIFVKIDSLPQYSYSWKKNGVFINGATSNGYWAKTPATYRVYVTNNACNETDSSTFVVTEKPGPSAIFSYADTCLNASVDFTDQSTTSSGSITSRRWFFGDGDTSSATSPSHNYDSAGTFTVRLIVTNSAGCSSDSISKTITINPAPAVGFTAPDRCNDTAVAFTNQTGISSGTFISKWTFGNGDTSTAKDPKYKFIVAGTHQVKLVATSNYGCKDSIIKSVITYPIQQTNFPFIRQCADSAYTFTDQTTISSGSIVSWSWLFDGQDTSSMQNPPAYTFSSGGTKEVKLTTVSDKGCIDHIIKGQSLYYLPVADFGFSSRCIDSAVSFTNYTTIGQGILNYKWNYGNGDSTFSTNPSYLYSDTGTYQVKLTAKSQYGCKDSIIKTARIYPGPLPDFNFSNRCLDSAISFSDQSSVPGGTVAGWSWSFGDNTSSIIKNPAHQYSSAGSKSVKLVAITDKGCRDSISKTITVHPLPVPSFGFIEKCMDSAIFFTDYSTISTGSISNRSWSFGDSVISSAQNPSHQYTSAGTKSVKLSLISDKGCRDSLIQTVNVHPIPQSSFSFVNRCQDSALSFTNNSGVSSGTLNYLWNFGDASGSALQDPSHQYSSAGNYNVLLTSLSNHGCRDSLQKFVTAFPHPASAFSFINRCQDSALSFSDHSGISSGLVTAWTWSFGDSTFGQLQNPAHQYSWSGVKTVKLVTISSNGCRDSLSKQVNVHPKPQVNFQVSDICADSAAGFTDLSTISSGSLSTRKWSFGDLSVSSSANPVHQYASWGSYPVNLVVTSNYGCKDSLQRNLLIHPLPLADFTVSNRCQDSAATFTDLSSVASGSISGWSWNFGDSLAASQTSPSHYYTYPGTKEVRLIAKTVNGCVDTIVKTLSIYPVPQADFSFSNRCVDTAASFADLSQILTGSIVSLQWNFGDAASSGISNPVHGYALAGSYQVSLLASSNLNCRDTTVKTIVIHPLPIAEFSLNSICQDSNVIFTDQSGVTSPDNISDWLWNFGDGDSVQGIINGGQFHFFDSTGIYKVKLEVISNHGCRDTIHHDAIVLPWLVAGIGTSNRCIDSSIQLSGISSVSIGNSIVGRYWDFGDGNTSALWNPSHQYLSPGTYSVIIRDTSSKGCVDSAVKVVKVHPIPVADFSHSNPCSNTGITFSDISTALADTMTSWNWDLGDGTMDSVKTPTHQYSVFGNYNVRLIAISQHGCRDTVTKLTNLYAVPVPDFSFSNKCVDSSLIFTDLSTIAGDSNIAWDWTFGDGSSSAQQNTTHIYPSAGNYQVQLIVSSNKGCSDTLIRTATANPLPVSQFSFINRCLDTAMAFVDLTTITTGGMQGWNWDFGDGNNSSVQHPSHFFIVPGVYNVTLAGTSDYGCKDTSSQAVTVNPLPVADFNFANRCLDTAVSFNDLSVVSTGNIVAWGWDFGDGSFSASQNPSHQYALAGTYTVALVITTEYGCKDTAIRQVIIHPLAIADFSFVNRCQDSAITFTDFSTVGSGNIVAWDWDLGDGNNSSAQHPFHKYNTDGNFIVSLIATTDFGCKDTISSQVTIFPRPIAQFSFTDRCLDTAISFVNLSSVISGNILESLWNFGDGNSSLNTSPQHQYNPAGQYVVKLIVTTNHGCRDSSSQQISVHPKPGIAFSFADKCQDSAVSFSDNSNISSGTIAGWEWDFDDTKGSVLQNPFHQYGLAGTYRVTLTSISGFGCRDTLSQLITIHPLPFADFSFINRCQDSALNFSDLSTVSKGSVISWKWDFGDSLTSFLQNPSHDYLYAGVKNAGLTVWTDKGCQSSLHQKQVIAFEIPNSDFTFNNKCLDSAVSFSDLSFITTGNILEWNWNFGDGVISALQNPVHKFPASGDYFITMVSGSDHGCSDTLLKIITIHPLPIADFNVPDGCREEGISFTDVSSVSKGSIAGWSWDFDDNGVASTQHPFFTYALHGTKKVKLVVTTDQGCRDTIEKPLVIFPKPDALFGVKEVCFGKATPFVDQTTIAIGNITQWNWIFGDGGTSVQQNPLYSYTQAGIYNTILIVVSDNGCKDTTVKPVKVFDNPAISFSSTSEEGCAPLDVAFTDQSTVNDGIISTWEWKLGDGNFSIQHNPLHSYRSPGTYSIIYTVTSTKGCTSTDTFANRISVFPVPVAGFYASPDSVSIFIPHINFMDLSSGTSTWHWDFGDNSSSGDRQPLHTFADTGRYMVRQVALSDNGCADTAFHSVFIYPDFTFFIPSSFTPNKDLINDIFSPGGVFTGIKSFEIHVYNRWGQEVSGSHDIYSSWNGNYQNGDSPCEAGVYMYFIRTTDYFGHPHEYSGNITLIR